MWKGKEKTAKRERNIAIALKAHNAKGLVLGEHLPEAQQVFRVKLSHFLRARVPLSKLQFFKELLEEGRYRLTEALSI